MWYKQNALRPLTPTHPFPCFLSILLTPKASIPLHSFHPINIPPIPDILKTKPNPTLHLTDVDKRITKHITILQR
jgi:hypothetical protein